MSAFSLLHHRSYAGLQLVTLCSTMDIIAISTNDNLLLYRTMSWEKIYSINYQEEFPSKVITSLCFHPSGKCLSIGCSDSSIVLLDIEAKQLCLMRMTAKSGLSDTQNAIISCTWQYFKDLVHDTIDEITNDVIKNKSHLVHHNFPEIWKYDGLLQIQRMGMVEYSDPNAIVGNNVDTKHLNIIKLTSSYLHFAITQHGMLQCHVLGMYPLFSVNMHLFNPNNSSEISYKGIQSRFYKHHVTYTYNYCDNTINLPFHYQLASINYLDNHISGHQFFCNALSWYEQAANLQLTIELNLNKLHDLVLSYSRKWKDACKVIIPKLNLLQDLLNTYQLNMSTIEFYYTVSLCGLWHPAAATAFSQHWNDQGVQRLKSSIDSSSRSIIKSLQTKAIPIARNTLLASRELLAIHEHIAKQTLINYQSLGASSSLQSLDPNHFIKPFIYAVTQFEQLLMKLDEALYESRLAREAMLLYIQLSHRYFVYIHKFIKDCILEVTNSTASSTPQSKPDPAMRPKYHQLFDPHHIRAINKGPQAQAEYVTGTHLYAYLQDNLSTHPINSIGNNSDSSSSNSSYFKSFIPDTSLETKDLTLLQEIFELSEKVGEDYSNILSKKTGEIHSKSILSNIKVMIFNICKELSQSLQYLAHDEMSSSLSRISSDQNPALSNHCNGEDNVIVQPRIRFELLSKESKTVVVRNMHLNTMISKNFVSSSLSMVPVHSMASLCDCLLTAIVNTLSNELIIICYGENTPFEMINSSNNNYRESSSSTIYCCKLSLLDIYTCADETINSETVASNMNRQNESNSEQSFFNADNCKIAFYTSTSKSDNSHVDVSLLLSLSPNNYNSSTTTGTHLFRLLLTNEEIIYTVIQYDHANDVLNAKSRDIIVSDAVLNKINCQSISKSICLSRVLPLRSVGMLVAEGERGVAVVCDTDGKLIVVDIEADDDEEEEEESDVGADDHNDDD